MLVFIQELMGTIKCFNSNCVLLGWSLHKWPFEYCDCISLMDPMLSSIYGHHCLVSLGKTEIDKN